MDFLRLFVVRHGDTAATGDIFNGWTDVALSELGRSQLDEAAETLSALDFELIVSSDLQRAAYGAQRLAALKGVEALIDPGFREMNFGDCETLGFKEIQARFPELAKDLAAPRGSDFVFPGGESAKTFRERISKALAGLRQRLPTGRAALFAHSGVGRAILAEALSLGYDEMWAVQQDHAGLSVLDLYPSGALRVLLVNGYLGPGGYRSDAALRRLVRWI
jgi:broad specificity phosphatase PhoE